MSSVTTTVLERHYAPEKGRSGKYGPNKFQAADGRKYETFDADVAGQAAGLLNLPVEITFDERHNGQYTNYDLLGIRATNGASPSVSEPERGTPAGGDEERQMRIMRQSALERAILTFNTAGADPLEGQDALLELADQYIDYFVNGRQTAPEGPVV